MLRVHTFGGCSVWSAGKRLDGISGQQKALALLALLAAEPGGVSRATALAHLWPESDEERARTSLRQLLHGVRTRLESTELVLGTAVLHLNPEAASSDIEEFRAALARGDDPAAAALHTGAFLDGFHLRGADEFERWAAATRATLTNELTRALTRLATAADERAALTDAIAWWQRLAAVDPLSSVAALGLMRAFDASGERASALRHARVHATLVRHELDAEPDRAVVAYAESLRVETEAGISRAGRPAPAHGTPEPAVAEPPDAARAPRGGSQPPPLEPTAGSASPGEKRAGGSAAPRRRRRMVGWLLLGVGVSGGALLAATVHISGRNAPDRSATTSTGVTHGTDSTTYELYLRGRHAFHNRIADDGVRQASRYFAEAVARDPGFAPAHAGLSDAHTRMAAFGYADPSVALRLAKESARRAVALDSGSAAGHVALAHALLLGDCAWDAAEREFRHANALDPAYTFGRAPFAMLLLGRGRYDEALAQLDTARTAEPLAAWVANVRGRVLVSAGRPDEAIAVLEAALALDPRLDLAHQQLGHALLARQMPTQALDAFRRGAELHGARDSAQLAYAYAVTGDGPTARRIVQRLTMPDRPADGPAGTDALAYHLAMAYAGLGEPDAAFDWLERARMEGAWCPIPAPVDPGFRSLHTSPRWRSLLVAMGLPVGPAIEP